MARCEDFPCCGHEANDCDGSLYGSDESIMAHARKHAYCDHEAGYCELEDDDLGEEEPEDGLSDVEADAMTLASAGWGTDEDYGFFGEDY